MQGYDPKKLLARLELQKRALLEHALDPIPEGHSAGEEFARRVGYKQGVDDMIKNLHKFLIDDDGHERDSDLKN